MTGEQFVKLCYEEKKTILAESTCCRILLLMALFV